MGLAGPNLPSTAADDAGTGTVAWSNPSNAIASDDTYASAVLLLGQVSHYLKLTNFGFSIPTTAVVTGIQVDVERVSTVGSALVDNAIRIVKGGVIGATDKSSAANWPSADAYKSYGSEGDLWGEAWSAGDINDTGFGVALSVTANVGATAEVDLVRARVFYAMHRSADYPYSRKAPKTAGGISSNIS